jgi:hypothetical protein
MYTHMCILLSYTYTVKLFMKKVLIIFFLMNLWIQSDLLPIFWLRYRVIFRQFINRISPS